MVNARAQPDRNLSRPGVQSTLKAAKAVIKLGWCLWMCIQEPVIILQYEEKLSLHSVGPSGLDSWFKDIQIVLLWSLANILFTFQSN